VTLERAAPSELPILLRGESGTGKERAARAIHAASAHAAGPFVAVDLGALPDALADGELFGHAPGAFTGAVGARAGLVEAASGGTLFLDEIGDATALVQMRLLRLLAEGTFRRLGETRVRQANVRVVSATHRDLEADVARGRFRADLWYRLAAVEVVLPPLRARGADLRLLARAFLERMRPGARFAPAAERALERHEWPGNVRELEWAVARAAVLAPPGPVVPLEALPERVRERARGGGGRHAERARRRAAADEGGLRGAVEALEARRIAAALAEAEGRPGRAAAALGISRQGLWRRLRRGRTLAPAAHEEESCRRRR
jgi:DNA-binding NtrC family response regulator